MDSELQRNYIRKCIKVRVTRESQELFDQDFLRDRLFVDRFIKGERIVFCNLAKLLIVSKLDVDVFRQCFSKIDYYTNTTKSSYKGKGNFQHRMACFLYILSQKHDYDEELKSKILAALTRIYEKIEEYASVVQLTAVELGVFLIMGKDLMRDGSSLSENEEIFLQEIEESNENEFKLMIDETDHEEYWKQSIVPHQN